MVCRRSPDLYFDLGGSDSDPRHVLGLGSLGSLGSVGDSGRVGSGGSVGEEANRKTTAAAFQMKKEGPGASLMTPPFKNMLLTIKLERFIPTVT